MASSGPTGIPSMILYGLLALSGLLLLIGITLWSVLAIYFGDSQTHWLQTLLAAAFALLGLATLVAVFVRAWRRRMLVVFSMAFAVTLGWWFSIEASNQRDWVTDVARLPYASIDGDRVTVHNIRNFSYRTEFDYTPAYYDRTFDLNRLDSIDLFSIYWMGPAIAHTIVSFGFGGEDYLAISIEARKEQGEGYSTIRGFFRQYEQIHIVGDERDLIGLRTNYRDNPPEDVYRYPLRVTPEQLRGFFLQYMRAINEAYEKPRFYNTLTSNCTNVIWQHASNNPDRVPFSWKILASGYAAEYLYEKGRLDTVVSFAELTRQGYVNPRVREFAVGDRFSQRIRGESPSPTNTPGS